MPPLRRHFCLEEERAVRCEAYGSTNVTFMMTFAGMAYMDYQRDGDRLSLVLAVTMGALQ